MTDQPVQEESPQVAIQPIQPHSYVLQVLIVAVVFFAVGFVFAWMLQEQTNQKLAETYNTALRDAVASITGILADSPQPSAQEEAPAAPRLEVSADDDPYIGPEDAPVQIIEFSDFKCPYCKRFRDSTLDALLEQYGDNVRFVYRDFPILGDLSFQAALASECADDQGAYWQYHDLLFANQSGLNTDLLLTLAGELNLDTETFKSCLDNQTYREEVNKDFSEAQRLGASGTPAFFINGRFLSGAQPLIVFQQMIDAELAALDNN